jgi:hypothetical protein
LERIAQDPELKELALMMRPSNAAHATNTRNVTLAKPGTATIQVSEGSAMTAKALAKNTLSTWVNQWVMSIFLM